MTILNFLSNKYGRKCFTAHTTSNARLIVDKFVSALFGVRDAYAMGKFLPISSADKIAPIAWMEGLIPYYSRNIVEADLWFRYFYKHPKLAVVLYPN